MDLRDVEILRPLRGRRLAVVACVDDAAALEALRPALAELEAELVVELEPGRLSARLGRPSVTVCDRWLEVVARDPADVLAELRHAACCCEECPQAGVEWALAESGAAWTA
jgi:hypothetical protein